MLYVFHVDSGRMLTFDMNIAVESVQYLKGIIERHHAIPAKDQVLLVSGGETLQNNARVGKYSAGTDTNPIFLFCKTLTECKNIPPWPSIDSEIDLKQQVDKCLELPATYNTVVTRAQLAQQVHEMAKEEFRICENLVMEQHLQQQGWCAVVANLEDITVDFHERCDVFFRGFDEHLDKRNEHLDYLKNFNDDLSKLAKIPILPGLLHCAENKRFSAFDEVYDDADFNKSNNSDKAPSEQATEQSAIEGTSSTGSNNEKSVSSSSTKKEEGKGMTLLQWISETENQRSLRCMAENCAKELERFNEKNRDDLKSEIKLAVDAASREDMKEIKGLEDRLQGLERLMFDAKKIVQEQSELSTAFHQNQMRAANIGDTSILPDLCASHKGQLMVMLQNHRRLYDIRRRCSKAKDELGANLFTRLRFISNIESRMWHIDSLLLFYHNCLKRLQKHLNIIEQIHQAPTVYVTAVNEVVRRKEFSDAFLSWASNLSCHLQTIYNDELGRRQDFAAIFDGHFLSSLFPGMNDMPPPFATEAPVPFDSSLPNLTRNDISELKNQLPEYSAKSSFLQEMDNVIQFFTNSRSQLKIFTSEESKVIVQGDSQMLKRAGLHSHLKEYEKGFESETDTEEFEKVGQSPIDRRSGTVNVQTGSNAAITVPPTINKPEFRSVTTSVMEVPLQSVETMTEESYESTQAEITRLKNLIDEIKTFSSNSIAAVRRELEQAKAETNTFRSQMSSDCKTLVQTWHALEQEMKNRERELVQRLTVDFELEMNDIRKTLSTKQDEIQMLANEKRALEEARMDEITHQENEKSVLREAVGKLNEEIEQLKTELDKAIATKAEAIKEIRDTHKTEMDCVRARLKLMASVDRSPSDTSLEKIERPDMIDIVNHEMFMAQLREDLDKEREKAVQEAVEAERARIQTESGGSNNSTNDTYKRIIEEKESQMDLMREHAETLRRENMKMRDRIQSLADSDIDGSQMSILRNRLDKMLEEKEKIENELRKVKQKLGKMQSDTSKRTATIESCGVGDLVTIVWNPTHEQFTIVQDSQTLYFLHAESYADLGLAVPVPPATMPAVLHTFGIVTKKDYCRARKDENRYKVSKGSQFYVIKAKPRVPFNRRDSNTTSTSSSQYRLSAQLIDSFAQTDLEPLFEQNDMIDSGVSEQQKSVYKDRTGSVDTAEEHTDEIDSSSAGGAVSRAVDVLDEKLLNFALIPLMQSFFSSPKPKP
ncbi:RB1-inducible coiled-coil protein 1 isoform X2 [Culicoides brevitarsis]|uniref:RB1-inducible coiled-coil protein 1 isoform X2 n=1 Tax=Culicoides brevitarsis TaxID=469753 RepID=UPI00307B745B